MATIGGTMATAGDVRKEQAEARVIERRRRLEEERKMRCAPTPPPCACPLRTERALRDVLRAGRCVLRRIFNAKQRTIGVDRQALEVQMQERNMAKEMERQRDQAFADRLLVTEQRVQLMDRDVQRARKDATISVQAYREQMQQKQMRKEWDLNDPLTLRKDKPARTSDVDPMIGPASLQKFSGEDLEYGNRVRKQQQQQAMWVVEQMAEKQAQIDNEREMERILAERQAEIDDRRAQMEAEELNSRGNMNEAVRDYNLALADVKKRTETMNRLHEMEDAAEEINNQLTGDFLTENPATTVSSVAPHRYLKYHFKGMSEEQRLSIRDEQVCFPSALKPSACSRHTRERPRKRACPQTAALECVYGAVSVVHLSPLSLSQQLCPSLSVRAGTDSASSVQGAAQHEREGGGANLGSSTGGMLVPVALEEEDTYRWAPEEEDTYICMLVPVALLCLSFDTY
jgi:hypothetical protein